MVFSATTSGVDRGALLNDSRNKMLLLNGQLVTCILWQCFVVFKVFSCVMNIFATICNLFLFNQINYVVHVIIPSHIFVFFLWGRRLPAPVIHLLIFFCPFFDCAYKTCSIFCVQISKEEHITSSVSPPIRTMAKYQVSTILAKSKSVVYAAIHC